MVSRKARNQLAELDYALAIHGVDRDELVATVALDYMYAKYQIDREELDAIASLKAVDPNTDIVAMCGIFTDAARDQQADQQADVARDQQAEDTEPRICSACAERAAISGLVNSVVQAVIDGVPFVIIEKVLKDMLR